MLAANLLLPIYYFANPAGGDGIDVASDFEQAIAMERHQHGQTWDAAIHAHDARGHVYARSMCDFDNFWGDR